MPTAWTPAQIMEAARAFQVSRLLLSAAELDLFTLLKDGPRSHQEVAKELGLDDRATRIFLDALAALGLLDKCDTGYYTPRALSSSLSSHSRESILAMLRHMATLWRRWGALTEVLKTGVPQGADSWENRPEAEREAFIEAMHVIGLQLAPQIVSSIPLEGVRSVLDVGGGSGTYAMAFLRAREDLRVTLLDLPSVIPLARRRLEEEGLLQRVELVAADFERDPLPPGHDMVFLSAIVHQNDREQNRHLFSKAHMALVRGGRIVIRDHIMEPTRTEPQAGAIFAVNMLVSTRGGTTYTFQELREDLEASGFVRIRWTLKGERMDSLVEATRGDDPSQS